MVALIDLCQAQRQTDRHRRAGCDVGAGAYRAADFRVLGEAEGIIDEFIAAWEAGERRGCSKAKKFEVDVTKSPIPRFDLLKPDDYLYIGVQFSRGCPFNCEFCDIIELYGRVPRAKTNAQMLAELDALYELGYRGHVDFVDDNLIGNKKAVKAFLPELAAWRRRTTIRSSSRPKPRSTWPTMTQLLELMREANFFARVRRHREPRSGDAGRDAEEAEHAPQPGREHPQDLWRRACSSPPGFIVGFDTEKACDGRGHDRADRGRGNPGVHGRACSSRLPNTQLTRRLAQRGPAASRCPSMLPAGSADQCTQGLNFDTLRPRREILLDYKRVLEKAYDAEAYAAVFAAGDVCWTIPARSSGPRAEIPTPLRCTGSWQSAGARENVLRQASANA